ncbi:MAG: LacI family DNA-binding transcriptional regulator [Solirubrobacteraceae bacterium]
MSADARGEAAAATITDVARRAGVSPATVSRFLSGQNIRHAEVVWRAIEELNYAPNRLARSLKSGRTRNIGVVVPDITNPFFGAVVKGIESSSSDQAYNLLLCNTDEDAERQDHLLKTLVGAVDALILTPAIESPDTPEALAHHRRVPAVLLDREFGDGQHYDSVLVDNVGGARQATRYLTDLGHRNVAVISGPLNSTPGRQRLEGVVAGMSDAGLELSPELIEVGDNRETGGYLAMKRLLTRASMSAVFVGNNLMAAGALRACKEARVRIPEELSFASFDDLELGELLQPTITTVTRPTVAQGVLAMSMLMDRLEGPAAGSEPRRCVMEVRLSVRDSCCPPRGPTG